MSVLGQCDPDAVGEILPNAEADPELDRLLVEVDEVLATEAGPGEERG